MAGPDINREIVHIKNKQLSKDNNSNYHDDD